MKNKKILIITFCLVLTTSFVGCKKTPDDISSTLSNNNNSSAMGSIMENTSQTTSTPSNDTTVSFNQNTTSATSSEEIIDLEEKYGFSSLKSVEYKCINDIPSGNAQYEITDIITNKGNSISYMGVISCKEKDITIDGFVVTVPYEYRQKHNSVTLTAKHRTSNLSCDFTITFEKWNLVFEDDFNGTQLDTSIWGDIWDTSLTTEVRDPFYFGYKKDMAFLDGKGNLINRVYATGDFSDDGRPLYKSSLISTKGCYESTYGYYEIRMIPHRANSIKGSFWLMAGDMGDPDAPNDNSSVNGCEIDIIETLSNLNRSCQALHWDGYYNGQTKSRVYDKIETPYIYDGKYHTFAVLWTPDEFIFTIDGKVTTRDSAAGGCKQPAYMLISSHVGTWGGDITLKPGEYSDMIVDYVRIYSNPNYK